MALATRCPYCQTTFRVVHDQLKLRSGMVRCGQCQHIFNGIEHLVRASNPAETAGASTAPAAAPVAPASVTPAAPVSPATPSQPPVAPATSATLVKTPAATAPAEPAAPIAPIPVAAKATTATTTAVIATPVATVEATSRQVSAPPASAPPAAATPAPVAPAADAPRPVAPAAAPLPRVNEAEATAPDEFEMLPWQDTEVDPAFARATEATTMPAPTQSGSTGDTPARHGEAMGETWPSLHAPETRPAAPMITPAEPHHHAQDRIEPTLDDDAWPESRNTLDVARAVASLEHEADNEAAAMSATDNETGAATRHHVDADAANDVDEPNFVKSGRRQQKWQRVWFWLQSFSLLILLLLLAAQAIYTWRDVIATRWPITKAHLQQACTLLHCKVELPTQIHLLSIELGELQALPRNKNTFSYGTLLRNHSNLPQSWPGIELVLLDANDHVVARRIFSPQDYQITPQERSKGFAAQSEHAVKLYFETAPQLKALGYRAEIFYP